MLVCAGVYVWMLALSSTGWSLDAGLSAQERVAHVVQRDAEGSETRMLTLTRVSPSLKTQYQKQGWLLSAGYEPQLTVRWPQGTQDVRVVHQAQSDAQWKDTRGVWNAALKASWQEGWIDRVDLMGRSDAVNLVSSGVLPGPVQRYRNAFVGVKSDIALGRLWGLGWNVSASQMGLWDPAQEAALGLQQRRGEGEVAFTRRFSGGHRMLWDAGAGHVGFAGQASYGIVQAGMGWSWVRPMYGMNARLGAVYASSEGFLHAQKARVLPSWKLGYERWWFKKGLRGFKQTADVAVQPFYDMFAGRVEPVVDASTSWVWVFHPDWSCLSSWHARHALNTHEGVWFKTQGRGDDMWAVGSAGIQYRITPLWYASMALQGMARIREQRNDFTQRQQYQYGVFMSLVGRMEVLD